MPVDANECSSANRDWHLQFRSIGVCYVLSAHFNSHDLRNIFRALALNEMRRDRFSPFNFSEILIWKECFSMLASH